MPANVANKAVVFWTMPKAPNGITPSERATTIDVATLATREAKAPTSSQKAPRAIRTLIARDGKSASA
jgi:hypothetical protein